MEKVLNVSAPGMEDLSIDELINNLAKLDVAVSNVMHRAECLEDIYGKDLYRSLYDATFPIRDTLVALAANKESEQKRLSDALVKKYDLQNVV